SSEFSGVEAVALAAELARHGNLIAFRAFGNLLRGEGRQQPGDLLARARALVADGRRFKDADALLVEQAIEQALDRYRRIGQLVVLDGAGERLRLNPGIVLLDRVDADVVR